MGELHENLISELPGVLYHVNIKKIQANDFKNDKKSENVRILQIDFAMSYSCEYQNEVQSALWSRESVTLFTAASFFESQCKTFVICSDTKQKDKDSIFTFVTYLYERIFEAENDKIFKEIIWSDGPSSEFKNRFMVTLLIFLSKKYNKKFEWKYFATSHGKGVIDGVGGNVKRLVNQKARSQGGDAVIQNAKDFATLAATLVPSTRISFISESEITEKIQNFHPWEAAKPVPGISKFHQISVDDHEVTCKKHALDSHSVKFSFQK